MSAHRRSASRSRSRVPLSRAHAQASSVAYLPGGAETLITPDGPIGSEAAELLGDIFQRQNRNIEASSSTLVGDFGGGSGQKTILNSDRSPGDDYDDTFEAEELEERLELEERAKRPFYSRPSAWWVSVMIPAASIAMSTTIAPRIEIYTKLACQALKPEYSVANAGSLTTWDTVPPPSKECGQDSDVQAAVAKLITFMTVSMGILSCLTTGWWGQFSDRYGRMKILRIAASGLLITDFNFILVTLAANRLPGGYRFLLVGPIIDGLLGGMTTLMAGLQAYISDSTPPEARSRIFSLNLGLFFCGMAFGPTIGSLIIRATNNLLSVFYLATGAHLSYMLLALFVIPESLTKASMGKAKKRRETARDEEIAACDMSSGESQTVSIRVKMWSYLKKVFGFLAPLGIFLPFRRPEGKGWNWNLTLVVMSYTFTGLLIGSYQFKFQYAQRAFGWDSETLGYWLSIIGVIRGLHLVIVLPLVIKWLTPKFAPIQLPMSPSEPLHPTRSASADNLHATKTGASRHSPTFDLALARISLTIELVSYVAMTLAVTPAAWTLATMFGSFGGGFSPAMQSVALALYERGPNKGTETGRLFGGLSVLQALSTQILGPSLFGFTYVSTVNIFPKGIFVLAGGAVACALLIMSFIRVPRTPAKAGHDREETAVEGNQGNQSQ